MSQTWVNDINEMQSKYGVHEWMPSADKDKLSHYLTFRVDFFSKDLNETEAAVVDMDA